MRREARLGETFADLAEVLVSDFDLTGLLHRLADLCVTVCDASGAGIVVADEDGALCDVAYSSEGIRQLERFQLRIEEGPCVECFRSGRVIQEPDLAAYPRRWPRFTTEALRVGIGSVCALPLRLRGRTAGALNLFFAEPRPQPQPQPVLRAAQALADLAMVGIVQYGQGPELRGSVDGHVKTVLVERSTIERAKGFLAERGEISMDEAFRLLREYAAVHDQGLVTTARLLLDRSLDSEAVLRPVAAREGRVGP